MAIFALLIGVSEQSWGDYYYGWGVNEVDGGGTNSSITKYYTFEEARKVARVQDLSGGYGPQLWLNIEPAHNPLLLLNPIMPTDGYTAEGILAPDPDSACRAGIATMPPPYGICKITYTGRAPFSAVDRYDWWWCQAAVSGPTGCNYSVNATIAIPHCQYPGYGYTEYGGKPDYWGRMEPPGVCDNIHWGYIDVNFDPGKCNDICDGVGNPVSPALGVKSHREILFAVASTPSPLRFEWLYSTKIYDTGVKRAGWSHTFSRRAMMAPANLGPVSTAGPVWMYRENGVITKFTPSNGVYVPDADIADQLTRLVDANHKTTGWTFKLAANEDVETYNPAGQLLSIEDRHGAVTTLAYSDASTPASVAPRPGLLLRITDALGRHLDLAYDASGHVISMSDPASNVYRFTYTAAGGLATITYPGPDAKVRTFVYENATYPKALTGIVDENGQRFATYTYDVHGRVASEQHAGGVESYSFAYNTDGSSLVTDPLGTTRRFGFANVLGAIRNTTLDQPCMSCGVGGSAVTYDSHGNIASRSDFNGKKICYAYDLTRNLETARVEGLLSSESCAMALTTPPSRPDVRKTATTWHATYRLPATIVEPAPEGARTTAFTYDTHANLTKKTITAPQNDGTTGTITRTWTWSYGTFGRLASATDPNGRVAHYAYYSDTDADLGKRGNVKSITNAAGHVTQITAYDGNGRPLSTTDPNGLVTTIARNARGRVTLRQVDAEKTTYAYDGVGQLTQVTLPDGSLLQYAYDGAHRLVQVSDGLGNRIVYMLDGMGNRIEEQVYDPGDNLARAHGRAYDALGRLQQDLGALGQTTNYSRDNNGNLTAVTDPLGHSTTNAYDALNRVTQVLDPANGIIRYGYDGVGNLTQVTDPRNNATTYSYDGLNNPVRLASPDTGVSTSTYDAAGNLKTRTDARGVTATYTVDSIDRVTKIVYSKAGTPNETHTFAYDSGTNAKGRMTQVVDTAGTTTWTYNSQGRVATKAQKIRTVTQTVSYGYNAAGQLATITTPSGQKVDYGYVNNRISAITLNGQTLLSSVISQPFGPLAAWHWGNGLFTFRDYDNDGRLATWEFRDGVSILRKDQRFDAAGRIIGIADPGNPPASGVYQYDALDRLTVAQVGNPIGSTQQFAYDALGNRLSKTVDGNATNYTYIATSNQLLALTGAMSLSYTYDGAGNPAAIGGLAYTYNNANRVVAVKSGSATLASYLVNALGQRVQKTVGTATTRFVYDERGHLLGEYDGAGKLIEETVWLEDLPVATLRPTGAAGAPTPVQVYYVHADHLGSPRAVTRPSDNAIMWQWDNIDPFGANAAIENPAGQGAFTYNLRFPGQYYDAETGTNYNYFRDYDPTIGRYQQSDPIGFKGGLNTYAYATSNPLRFTDKFGRDRWGIPEDPWYPGVKPPFHVRPDGNPWGWGCGDKDTDHNVPDMMYGVDLTPACRTHDLCYERACEPGVTQEMCDEEFRKNIKDLCLSAGKPDALCNTLAWSYYQGVKRGGHHSFDEEKNKCCK